ncbi:hypothetical protein M430DRAFT_26375 [Amorphotheca resinae ATCC 22711]|uniref:Uncharacterized protein n=1 Tax=Amorphotheca resinae ATCC 22711 TaxID=857342 RepID=A0A2T3B9G2_AMORE|nr:hypothetical protein M430DRAFT_26375 [Amorphotheca resinae ATCC 22711]PSS23481.1 hypothetical protein M430DRAFT_26375 [Amorphotheca resinae ATCC 22711]
MALDQELLVCNGAGLQQCTSALYPLKVRQVEPRLGRASAKLDLTATVAECQGPDIRPGAVQVSHSSVIAKGRIKKEQSNPIQSKPSLYPRVVVHVVSWLRRATQALGVWAIFLVVYTGTLEQYWESNTPISHNHNPALCGITSTCQLACPWPPEPFHYSIQSPRTRDAERGRVFAPDAAEWPIQSA